jgi:hypothetical protein
MSKNGNRVRRGVGAGLHIHPAAAGGGVKHPRFIKHAGPVIASPKLTTSFWGPGWSVPANRQRADRLNQFLRDLLASKYMNILTQYGVGAGAFVGETLVPAVAAVLTDADIQATIQKAVDNGTIAEPGPNSALVIYLDDGIGVQDKNTVMCEPANDDAFGYHSSFKTKNGNEFFYAVVPGINDDCVRNTCPDPVGCSLSLTHTREERQTQVTSHEVAEMLTDPAGNAWFDDDTGDENGDICNGKPATIKVGTRTWTVQKMYSKVDDVKTKGTTTCVVAPNKPLPPAH